MRKENLDTMEKETNNLSGLRFPMNLQFFANKADDPDDDLDDDDNPDDDDSDDDPDDDDDKTPEDKNKGEKKEKTFTQSQVSKMTTREKNQGRAAALRELGIDPKNKEQIAEVKAYLDSKKTDEQKAAEAESESQSKIAEANHRALIAETKAEAMMMGVKSQFVDDVITLAISKMSDDEDSDLKTILGEFKIKYPAWFSVKDDDKEDKKDKAGQKGTGSSLSSKRKKELKENKGMGARLAAQRKTRTKKTSYWS